MRDIAPATLGNRISLPVARQHTCPFRKIRRTVGAHKTLNVVNVGGLYTQRFRLVNTPFSKIPANRNPEKPGTGTLAPAPKHPSRTTPKVPPRLSDDRYI
jgi:hypothetical protein